MNRRDVLRLLLTLPPAAWASRSLERWGWLSEPGESSAAAPALDWAWSGGVTTDTAVVVAKVRGLAAPLALVARHAEGPIGEIPGVPVPGASGVHRFTLTGLRSATEYRCEFVTPAGPLPGDLRLRTFAVGPQNIRLVFGSCASTGSNSTIFDVMRERRPDLLVHMGDMHYEDIRVHDVARFRRAFDRVLASPRQGALYRSTPVAYVWDDHDFGGDGSDRLSPSAAAAHQVFREYVPHYPLSGEGRSPVQQALSIGRVRVIVTDARSGRDRIAARGRNPGAAASMLGPAQRAWLLRELEAARDAPLVVWANPVPWITKGDERTHHGWAPFSPERVEIANHIETLGLTRRLVMISGDAHMIAIDDGTNSQYAANAPAGTKGFPVIHGASFDRFRNSMGGPYSHGHRAHRGQFGQLDIKDDGVTIAVTATCCNKSGIVLKQLEFSPAPVNRATASDV